uniref:Uncharacterized protein n=1 Tax=Trypanosoma congolense (strain IL3000) TaxID=1068625 RepID=G0UML2_TRYCI|nr:hypothetical protein, unlikely [Trypanosoma congolense IL3000]
MKLFFFKISCRCPSPTTREWCACAALVKDYRCRTTFVEMYMLRDVWICVCIYPSVCMCVRASCICVCVGVWVAVRASAVCAYVKGESSRAGGEAMVFLLLLLYCDGRFSQ